MLCFSPPHYIPSLQDPLEFPAHELKKHFKTGDHVKVIGGKYEGDTGLIVRVEENIVVLFSDLTMHEVNSERKNLLCVTLPLNQMQSRK